jgi:hypothetical protein
MTVPYTFGTATTSIPLSNLDANFNTPITLGNTSIYLGNTTTTIGNLTLTNVTISSGSANITSNITYATANAVVYTNSSNVGITSTSLTFNGTNLGVGNANPQALLHVGSVVEAPGFGTTSQMTYINGTSQPELLLRQTVNDVVVSMYADSTSGSIRTATNHPLIFFTNNTDRMRITSAGDVGINTTPSNYSDYVTLALNDTTGSLIELKANATGNAELVSDNNGFMVKTVSATPLNFGTNNTEKMRITSTGTVYLAPGGLFGVGVSSPGGAIGLGVSPMTNQLILGGNTTDTTYGAISFSGDNSGANRIGLTGGGGSDKALYLDSPTGGAFYFRINAVNRQEISSAGIVTMSAYGAGTATFAANGSISSVSDETWKTKDGVPTNTDAMLQKLEPGYWFYNAEKAPIFGADRQLGFYAQNVREAIGSEAAPTPEEGKPWGYYDRSVLAVAVMSLKNALNTIEELKQKITALENK